MTMAGGNAFDRQIIQARERPMSSDVNTAESQLDRSLRETLQRLFTAAVSGSSALSAAPPSGFIGEGLKVYPTAAPGLSVLVKAGLGFQDLVGDVPASIGGVVGLDDLARYKPLLLAADATINGIPAGPSAGTSRYDIVEVRMNRVSGNLSSRDVLNTTTGIFDATMVNKTLGFTLDGSTGVVAAASDSTAAISYKYGVAGASPAIPTGTAGYVTIAVIYSNNGNMTGSVVRSNIIDKRQLLMPSGMMPFTLGASIPSGATSPPTAVAFSGPPSVECVVVKNAQPAHYRFTAYILGGAINAASRGGMGGCVRHAYAAGEFANLGVVSTTFGTLDPTLAALLANANLSSPALAFAEGTPYMAVEFYASRQAAGVTDNAVVDPMVVDIQGSIQRY
jgi:hypothetical protein